jgi:hypothetical protein
MTSSPSAGAFLFWFSSLIERLFAVSARAPWSVHRRAALLDRLAARIEDTMMTKSTGQTIKRWESNDQVSHFPISTVYWFAGSKE